MIKFRQKEFNSSIGTQISYGIEQIKETLRKKKMGALRKIVDSDPSKVDPKKKRAANIELHKETKKGARGQYRIKRDAIKTREAIKDTVTNPKKLAAHAGKITDKTIQFAIKHPQHVVSNVNRVVMPVAAAAISPAAVALTTVLPVSTAIDLVPLPKNVNERLRATNKRYRNTNISKKLRGRPR